MKKSLYIVLLSLLSMTMAAQVVYQCDFEDEEERAQWVLNTGNQGPKCVNKWYFGEAGNHAPDAHYGLFVSSDGTEAIYDASKTMFVVSYRELTIPAGDYDVYFDWRCNGKRTGEEGFYFCWIPESVTTNSNMATADLPNWAKDEQYLLAPCFHGSTSWNIGHFEWSLPEEQTRKLVLIWYNTRGSAATPSACIDNIEIVTKGTCPLPTNFKHQINNDASVTIDWQKNGISIFDVRTYDYQTGEWQMFSDISNNRVTLYGLSEGFHDIYVRPHCTDGDGVGQFEKYSFFMYHKGERCIDYMDLSTATCRVGDKDHPLGSPKVEDHGYADYENSLHTLHYVPNERDPYTDGTLLTKPADALASVRLGRYAPTFGAACEYKYRVPDDDKAILKVHYAVVLPAPHEPQDNPTFRLEILANNRSLDYGCGIVDFIADPSVSSGWKSIGDESNKITWKDWTELAINLRDYVGQTITVRLMVTGCKMSAHGAYAYFTLGCESGEMSGLNCGEDNPTTTFTAPSGFDYEWYLPEAPDKILSTKQTFTIDPMDTLHYNVDVISQTNSKCYYTMEACGIPRFPVAIADVKNEVVNCQNEVTFHNQSCVYYKNQVTEKEYTMQEGVDHVYWDFGDGTISTLNDEYVTHTYPDSGGTYTATLYAYLNGNDTVCVGESQIPIVLDDVRIPARDVHISIGSMYDGKVYWNPYEFDTVYTLPSGCEERVHVHVHERNFEQSASFCEGGVYEIGDQKFSESGTYVVNLKSQWDLDSIVTLTLDVEPALRIELADTIGVCADQANVNFPIQITQGKLDSIFIRFSEYAVKAGFDSLYSFGAISEPTILLPKHIIPGYYPATVKLGTPRCPTPDVPVVVQVSYPSSIVAQKEGLIALLNDHYNGGYSFSSYQWYRNGVLMSGADQSYIIVGEGDLGAQYTVVLTRSSDGVRVVTCPIVYNGAQGIDDVMTEEGPWMLMDLMGRVVVPLTKVRMQSVSITPGVYILVRPDSHQTSKIIIR